MKPDKSNSTSIFTFDHPLYTGKKKDEKPLAIGNKLTDIVPEREKYPSTPRPSSTTSTSRKKKIPNIPLHSQPETEIKEERTFSPRPSSNLRSPRNSKFSTHRLGKERIKTNDGEEAKNLEKPGLSTIEESVNFNTNTFPEEFDTDLLPAPENRFDPKTEIKTLPESLPEQPNPKPPGTEKIFPEMEDEFFEHHNEFPGEKKQPETKKLQIKNLHRTRLSNVNPKTPQELAEAVKFLIEVDQSREMGTVRALKALYCAAGGDIQINPEQPETRVYVQKLRDLAIEQRWGHLSNLLQELRFHLPEEDRRKIGGHLANLYSDTYKTKNNTSGQQVHLNAIKSLIEARLSELH